MVESEQFEKVAKGIEKEVNFLEVAKVQEKVAKVLENVAVMLENISQMIIKWLQSL